MKSKDTVFRQRMVERLSATDELSEPLRLDPLQGWPLIAAVLLLLVMATLWALGSSSPVTVDGVGIVELDGHTGSYRALLYTTFQQKIEPGQPVRLETLFGDSTKLSGRVLTLAHEPSIRRAMETDLADPDLARRLYEEGQRRRISVELEGAESIGPAHRRQVKAWIEIGRRRPIEQLFPNSAFLSPSPSDIHPPLPRSEQIADAGRGG